MLAFDIDVARLAEHYGYFGVASIVALESLGVPIPGETALVAAAIYAGTTHNLRIDMIVIAAALGAFVGGNGGYWLGRHFGFPLLKRYGGFVSLDAGRLKVAQYLFRTHGGKVVFFGRFVAFLRAFASILAGANGMSWRHFLIVNGLGGAVWAVAFGTLGYSLGKNAEDIITKFGLLSLVAVAIAVVASVSFFHRHEKLLLEKAEKLFPGPLSLRAEGAPPPLKQPRPRET